MLEWKYQKQTADNSDHETWMNNSKDIGERGKT